MLWQLPACLSLSQITCSCLHVALLSYSYLVSPIQKLTNFFLVFFSSLGSVPWPRSSCASTTGGKKCRVEEKRGRYKPAFTLLPKASTLSQAQLDPTQLSVLPRNQDKQIGKVSMKFQISFECSYLSIQAFYSRSANVRDIRDLLAMTMKLSKEKCHCKNCDGTQACP